MASFLSRAKTLMMATVSPDGLPNISYAPFVVHDGKLFVLLSGLAEHLKNLVRQPICHAMIIEDETDATNIYARKRLSLHCNAVTIDRGNALFETVVDDMQNKLGETVKVLRGLGDFHLVCFEPQSALLVDGFASARNIDPQEILSSI